jgi:hypothetical protein
MNTAVPHQLHVLWSWNVTIAKTKAVWEIEGLIAASFNIHESESFLFLH